MINGSCGGCRSSSLKFQVFQKNIGGSTGMSPGICVARFVINGYVKMTLRIKNRSKTIRFIKDRFDKNFFI
jgi:hypothetical protein